MYWTLTLLVLLALTPGVTAAQSPRYGRSKETVYVIKDSLDWVLSLHLDQLRQESSCEVATKKQPGARAARFHNGVTWFVVHFGDPVELMPRMLEYITLRLSPQDSIIRKADHVEIVQNIFMVNGAEMTEKILPLDTLRLRAHYRRGQGDGGFQDVAIPLAGLKALVPRIYQRSCTPPPPRR